MLGFIVSSQFFFFITKPWGAISGALLWLLSAVTHWKYLKTNSSQHRFWNHLLFFFILASSFSHTSKKKQKKNKKTLTLIHHLVPLLRRGLLIGWWGSLRCFLQVRDIGKVILLCHTNGQSQDHQLPFTGSPQKSTRGRKTETERKARKGVQKRWTEESSMKKMWCKRERTRRGHFRWQWQKAE